MNGDAPAELVAEQAALKRLLADLPADHALERLGFESRLEEIEELLASQQNSQP